MIVQVTLISILVFEIFNLPFKNVRASSWNWFKCIKNMERAYFHSWYIKSNINIRIFYV